MKKRKGVRARRIARKLLILFAALVLLIAGGAGILFRDELKLIRSMERIMEEKRVYYMEAEGDYHFEEFLKSGGAASDQEVSAFLTKHISKGFYSVTAKESGLASLSASYYFDCDFEKAYRFCVRGQ